MMVTINMGFEGTLSTIANQTIRELCALVNAMKSDAKELLVSREPIDERRLRCQLLEIMQVLDRINEDLVRVDAEAQEKDRAIANLSRVPRQNLN